MTFRTVSIGFSAALLALACGSNDDNNTPDNGGGAVIQPPPVQVGDTPPPPAAGDPGGGVVTPPPAAPPPRGQDAADLARAAAENILKTNCGDCHGSQLSVAQASKGMNYIDNTDELVKQGKLVPLSPDTSLVVTRMKDGSMPPPQSGRQRVTQGDIDVLLQYIDNPRFWPDAEVATTCDDQLATWDDIYSEVSIDLLKADDEDAANFRYISLANRFTAGVCADGTSLDRDRQALNKMVNALSINAKVEAPQPVNPEETLFRIDLRDYDWDRAINVVDAAGNVVAFDDVWEAIVGNNAYAVPFVGEDADQARLDAETDVPVMLADSMLDAATIGNVYYAIVDVDVTQTLSDFILNDLQIDVDQNLIDEDQVRAGTSKSILSKQDRVVQRDDIENGRAGVLWQSFDFLADDQNDSIYEDPFGFAQGGTEAIFTLPNGMLAYIIADENDAIVEDSDILLDASQGNNRAITSVSCSSCHASGFIPVVDEVRTIALDNAINFGLNNDEVQQLKSIYVEPDEFARVIDDDTKGFYQAALSRADLPLQGVDPVSFIFLQFDADLQLATAAGDLGVTPDQLDNNINELDPALGVLRSGKIDRDDFTAVYVDSLCKLNIASENVPDATVCADAAALLLQ